MNITKTLAANTTALCVALLLFGCENEEYQAISCLENNKSSAVNCATPTPDPTPTDTYQEKDGVTGRVLAAQYWEQAQVCFDLNGNGRCDKKSEPVTSTFNEGKFSFSAAAVKASVAQTANLLAVNIAPDGNVKALYAPTPASATRDPDNETNITLFTTLVVNEMSYNPYTLANKTTAITALSTGTMIIGSDTLLQGLNYLIAPNNSAQVTKIAASLAQAQGLAETHYLTTAAMVDKIYQSSQLDVTINQSDIAKQNSLTATISASLSQESTSWTKNHDDEENVALTSSDGIAIIGAKYHNSITILDTNTVQPSWLSSKVFAQVNGKRDQVDAVTGATEQTLTEIRITPDNLSLIVAVEKYAKESDNLGVGIYRANLSDYHNIPSLAFASADNNSQYYSAAKLKDIAISADGLVTALVGDDRKLTLLNTSDLSLKKVINVTDKARAIALDNSANIGFVGVFGSKKGVAIFDLATAQKLAFIDTTLYPDHLELFSQDSKLIVQRSSSNLLSIYDVSTTAEPSLITTITASDNIKAFSVSPDGSKVLIALTLGRLELYSLASPATLLQSLTTNKDSDGNSQVIKTVKFNGADRALIALKNAIQTLTVVTREVSNWSDEDKLNWFNSHRK